MSIEYHRMDREEIEALEMHLQVEGQGVEFDSRIVEGLALHGLPYADWTARCNQFVRCAWSATDLYAAHFQQSIFQDCRFEGVMLRKSDLNGCAFLRCVFVECNFTRADLIGCTFENVTFTRCDFSGATLCSGVLQDVKFLGCETAGSFIGENEELLVVWQPWPQG